MDQFISFAQNNEDVILWRALRHVEHGFYVDCGAYSPTCHSVTKAFYDRGWRGINIEPVPHLLHAFVAQRPNDINLNVAIADHADGATFYEVLDTGLSTFSADAARRHIEAGHMAKSMTVPTADLSDILRQHAGKAIHFLKIDVEGAERLVLDGLDLVAFRPWIVVVEAVKPQTQEPNHQDWEPILLSQGFCFAYFDGLNRFYVANEHSELIATLAVPPNIFDNFAHIDRVTELAAARQDLAMLKQSSSWRITAPIRKAKLALHAMRDHLPHQIARRLRRLLVSGPHLPRAPIHQLSRACEKS